MAVFDGHFKCARFRDKGVFEDLCLQKTDCPICKVFSAEQKTQLATSTYRARKDKEHTKKTIAFPSTAAPSLVDHKHCKLLGRVEGGSVLQETLMARRRNCLKNHPKPARTKTASQPLTTRRLLMTTGHRDFHV